jgi:hypothetical protein
VLDLGSVLNNLLDTLSMKYEKNQLKESLVSLSGHETELTKAFAQAYPDLARRVLTFFQHRVDDHRRSLRISKLLSFKSSESIERESVMMALDEVRVLVSEISILKEDTVRRLVDNHGKVLRQLTDTLVGLMHGQGQPNAEQYREGIRNILRGVTGNENV